MSRAAAKDDANKIVEALQQRVSETEAALDEARETLDAIRNGEVDAVVVGGPDGHAVYTLENADRPYRVLVEQMQEGAVTLTADGLVLYCNRRFADLIDRQPEKVLGHSIYDHILETARLRPILTKGEAASAELTLRRLDGGVTPVKASIVELAVEIGAEPLLCAVFTDLSPHYDRRRELSRANSQLAAEIAERRRTQDSLLLALDAADMGSWDLDLTTRTSRRNARHDAIFGHQGADWDLDIALSHFIAEDQEAVSQAFAAAEFSGRIDIEGRIRRADDGVTRWVHILGRTFSDDDGSSRIAGVVTDVTDRRLVEEQLRQAQKMEAVGQLTGGIAHDFNNLLMIIGGSLETLGRRVELDERALRLLDAARMGVSRGAKLNEQLLAFSRRQDMRLEVFKLDDHLPTFADLLDRAVGETVRVEIRRGDGRWSCRTDPHQLETAILNLAINARDAMPDGGTLTLATADRIIGADEAARFEARAGDYTVIFVEDTGAGMAPGLLAHVFEPFFTTKAAGKGTGLGLSQVYGFAKQSDGFVTIDSVLGKGTRVSIYLPRSDLAETTPEKAAAVPQSLQGEGVVLLVEDDADVRAASAAMVEELGYTVRSAPSGSAALAMLEAGEPVDVIFSDVIMATGMDGIQLARIIRAQWPNLPVILTSGYTAQRSKFEGLDADLPLLRKPYRIDQLATALHGALDKRDAPRRRKPAQGLRQPIAP